MRLFLAIELPDEIKQRLDKQIQPLKKEYPHFNWTPIENFHITIHHFGDVEEVNQLEQKIDHSIYDIPSFHLYALSADLFMTHKIVVYISFNRQKILEQLVQNIEDTFQTDSNKQYLPHLTIARTKIPSKQQYLLLNKKLERLEVDFDFPVEKVVLFESIAGAKNPIYKKMTEFNLQERI